MTLQYSLLQKVNMKTPFSDVNNKCKDIGLEIRADKCVSMVFDGHYKPQKSRLGKFSWSLSWGNSPTLTKLLLEANANCGFTNDTSHSPSDSPSQ